MYCCKCGEQLPDESVFCAYCGEKQSDQPQPLMSSESRALTSDDSPIKPVHKPGSTKKLRVILIVVGVILAFFIIRSQSYQPISFETYDSQDDFSVGSAASPNITAEQIKRDLVENDVYITTAWWEQLYHLRFKDFTFEKLEITKTLTEEKTVYYHVIIAGKSYQRIDNKPFVVTYKKFNEGWAFTSIRYDGNI